MNKGQFQKGNKGKPKGAINNTTKELREKFTQLVENNIEKLQSDIDLLEPKDRVKILLDLSKFVIPTLRSTELTTDENNEFQNITISFTDTEDYSNYSTEDLKTIVEIGNKYRTKNNV